MDHDRALELIDSERVAVLTTIRRDGRARPVPVVFARLTDGRIVTAVDHKPKSTRRLRRLDDIAGDDRVSLLWHRYAEEWSDLWWVRADGRARVLDHAPADVAQPLVDRYEQYREQPPEGPWIEIRPDRVVGWP